jgi:hypothetical protein
MPVRWSVVPPTPAEHSVQQRARTSLPSRARLLQLVVRRPLAPPLDQALIFLVLVSAPRALTATFTASSIGSLNGTSIRSRPFS